MLFKCIGNDTTAIGNRPGILQSHEASITGGGATLFQELRHDRSQPENFAIARGYYSRSVPSRNRSYNNPMVAKRDGYNVHALDVFSREQLQRNIADDPYLSVSVELENVDFAGSAIEIAELAPEEEHGQHDAILSSHNFEYLPNPIKFSQDCERTRKPGGKLIMAVPDARAAFDIHRPLTTVGEWLEAWLEDRERPTPKQIFEHHGLMSFSADEGPKVPCSGFDMEGHAIFSDELQHCFDRWTGERNDDTYSDAHSTVMIRASVEAIILEIKILGLVSLERCTLRSLPGGYEFMIRVQKTTNPKRPFHFKDARLSIATSAMRGKTPRIQPEGPAALLIRRRNAHQTKAWRAALQRGCRRRTIWKQFGDGTADKRSVAHHEAEAPTHTPLAWPSSRPACSPRTRVCPSATGSFEGT